MYFFNNVVNVLNKGTTYPDLLLCLYLELLCMHTCMNDAAGPDRVV